MTQSAVTAFPMEQRLSLITLGVSNLDRSTAFYEALGWRRALRSVAGVAFFQLGGIGLSLYPEADLAADAQEPLRRRDGFPGFTLAHNVRSRDEVDALVDPWVAAGGFILDAPRSKDWGGYSGYFCDPDGFPWEIAWNPGFPIGVDGAISIPAE